MLRLYFYVFFGVIYGYMVFLINEMWVKMICVYFGKKFLDLICDFIGFFYFVLVFMELFFDGDFINMSFWVNIMSRGFLLICIGYVIWGRMKFLFFEFMEFGGC